MKHTAAMFLRDAAPLSALRPLLLLVLLPGLLLLGGARCGELANA
ncbi:MAG TPA: hypothetical protein VL994_02455 [Steroidobacteraceae bacterium]|nr:hypothetical protein [Steroidobacteraceae bacterium]